MDFALLQMEYQYLLLMDEYYVNLIYVAAVLVIIIVFLLFYLNMGFLCTFLIR